MSNKVTTIIWMLVFVLFIVGAVFAYNVLSDKAPDEGYIPVNSSKPIIENKKKAPDFTVVDSEGNAVKLSDMMGKPVVLNFWASWCPPCKNEMPDFETAFKEYGDDINFMMIDLVDEQRETKEMGAKYIMDQGYTFPVYFDINQEGSFKYINRYIPVTVFIDRDGNIISSNEGGITKSMLENGIKSIK